MNVNQDEIGCAVAFAIVILALALAYAMVHYVAYTWPLQVLR